jgi:hypothetical protein
MASRRFLPFFLSTLFTGALLLAAAQAIAVVTAGSNYTLGTANISNTIPNFNPTPQQPIPVAYAVIAANATAFVLNASGINATNPITGNIDGSGNITITGPKGVIGVGNVTSTNFTLNCSYPLGAGSQVTYHYIFNLVN